VCMCDKVGGLTDCVFGRSACYNCSLAKSNVKSNNNNNNNNNKFKQS
jgi:hypothetical protein